MTDETAKELAAAIRQLAESIERSRHYQPLPNYPNTNPWPGGGDPYAPGALPGASLVAWGYRAGNYS